MLWCCRVGQAVLPSGSILTGDLVALQVDADRNLVYVKGQVPGHKGNWVFVRDAVYKTAADQPQLPWPTAAADQPAAPPASPDLTDPFAG